MSNSLRPHGLQHARSPCPSPTPGVYSNSCPLTQRCHPTISSSAVPFSSHIQSFPALYTHIYTQINMHTIDSIYAYVYIHMYMQSMHVYRHWWVICIFICMHTHTIYIYIYVCVYIYEKYHLLTLGFTKFGVVLHVAQAFLFYNIL